MEIYRGTYYGYYLGYSVTDMKIKDIDRLTEVVTSCTMVARGRRYIYEVRR